MKNFELSSTVNGKSIEVTGFPRDFMANMLAGAASSLKGVGEIHQLELTMKYGKVKMVVNGGPISLGPFPTLILARTLIGMASTLKGVEGEITSLEVKMQTTKPGAL